MWRSVTRLVGVVLAIVLSAALVSCSEKNEDKPDSPDQAAPNKPATPWDKTLAKVKPDGTVDTETALSAFVQAIGPIPGVKSPGKSDNIYSGTIAIRWVQRHWADLKPEQQAAVETALNPPTPNEPAAQQAAGSIRAAAPPEHPNIACQTKDTGKTEPYRGVYDAVIGEMERRLWRLTVPVYFAENTRQIGANAAGYATPCFRGEVADDKLSACTIHFNPRASAHNPAYESAAYTLVHELTHCFIMARFGSLAEARMPDWFAEGAPEWISTTLASDTGGNFAGWWRDYLKRQGTPLSQLTYDGVGFFAHLEESGKDTWAAIVNIANAVAKSPSTAAGWHAADVNQEFLDSWGSGFAQGRYPGAPWLTGGSKFEQFQPDIPSSALANGDYYPIATKPTASDLRELRVSAEVVLVEPDTNSAGRISLGGGKDMVLNAAAGQNFCTLDRSKCKCPEDSDKADMRFTHMDPGTEWLGLTGGPEGAKVFVRGVSLEEFCKTTTGCIAGTWTSEKITGAVPGVQSGHGGAGVRLTIGPKGELTVDYTGMKRFVAQNYLTGTVAHTTWRGTQVGTVKVPRGPATSGRWKGKAGSDNVIVSSVSPAGSDSVPLQQWLGKGITPGFVSPMNSGTWRCSGKTLTLALTFDLNGSATGTWTLVRK